MAKPQKQPSRAVQLRVFTQAGEKFTERQIFDNRAAALFFLREARRVEGLLLDYEGHEGDQDPYAVFFPWSQIALVDIIPFDKGSNEA